jgi:hypothetical protein
MRDKSILKAYKREAMMREASHRDRSTYSRKNYKISSEELYEEYGEEVEEFYKKYDFSELLQEPK